MRHEADLASSCETGLVFAHFIIAVVPGESSNDSVSLSEGRVDGSLCFIRSYYLHNPSIQPSYDHSTTQLRTGYLHV